MKRQTYYELKPKRSVVAKPEIIQSPQREKKASVGAISITNVDSKINTEPRLKAVADSTAKDKDIFTQIGVSGYKIAG